MAEKLRIVAIPLLPLAPKLEWMTIPELIARIVATGAIKIDINKDHTEWSAGLSPSLEERWAQVPGLASLDLGDAIAAYMRAYEDFPRTHAIPRRFYTLTYELRRDVLDTLFAEAAQKVGQGAAYLETMTVEQKRETADGQPRYPARSLQAGQFMGQGHNPDYDPMDDESRP